MTWPGSDKDVELFVHGCGLCLSFSNFKITPWTERSLTRTTSSMPLFSHISIDPLGPLRVNFDGSKFSKLCYPLAIVDINLSMSEIVLMQGLSTKDVFMALMMLQERYHMRITQLFSDGGSKGRLGSANETYYFTVSILKEKTMKESCNFQHHVG